MSHALLTGHRRGLVRGSDAVQRTVWVIGDGVPLQAKILAYLQLLRLPNVFTAIAEVAAAFLFAGSWTVTPALLSLLIPASCCLYLAGMVLNDLFDRDLDAGERPFRPIPSGRVSSTTATALGFGLLFAGVFFGAAASAWSANPWPGMIGGVLAIAVVLYDAILKRTPLGPAVMGLCRFGNVLLGMSLAPRWEGPHIQVAAAIGIYVAGITWFARRESTVSSRRHLLAATGVILLGLGLLAWQLADLPLVGEHPRAHNASSPTRAAIMVIFSGAILCRRCLVAVALPIPMHVQSAVGVGILSLIVLDAIIVFATSGLVPALAIVSLLIPALVLGVWVYKT